MSIELAIIGLALVLALVFKGSPKSFFTTKLRHKWTLIVALAGHLFVELAPINENYYSTVGFAVLMATYLMLFIFCIANIKIRPLIAVFIGLACNAVVTALNGHMPVTTNGDFIPRESIRYSAETSQDLLPQLGSMIPINAINTALSAGDLVFAFGMFMFFFTITRKKTQNNVVDLTSQEEDQTTMELVMAEAALSKNEAKASSYLDRDEYVDIRIDEDLEATNDEEEEEFVGSGNVAVLEKELDQDEELEQEMRNLTSSHRPYRTSKDSVDKLNRRNRRARKRWQQAHGLNALPKPEDLGFDQDSMTIVDAAQ